MKLLHIAKALLLVAWITSCHQDPGHGNSARHPRSAGEMSEKTDRENDSVPENSPPGRNVYDAYCLTCHQADGSGVPMMYPPLIESDWATGDKVKLIKLILEGTQGPVEVKGEMYNSIMPPQNQLTDQQIADLLTYLRSHFGNGAGPVTPDEVGAVRNRISE